MRYLSKEFLSNKNVSITVTQAAIFTRNFLHVYFITNFQPAKKKIDLTVTN